MSRPIFIIAREILDSINAENWPSRSAYAAIPYAKAMLQLDSIHDYYHADTGRSVVLYFLSNAATWRGEKARRIKAELKELLR